MCVINKLFAILIIVLLIFLFYIQKQENWVNYQQLPLGNFYTASEPVALYRKDRYRLPYMYPVCHPVDYPVGHCKHLE